jgi:nitroreductase
MGFATLALPLAGGGCAQPRVLGDWNGVPKGVDARTLALSYAVLAPNAHNTQPWLVELVGQHGLRLYVDRERLLPATDPLYRQVYVSQGTFLELFCIGASSIGHGVDVRLFPEGTEMDAPVASLTLSADEKTPADPLVEQVTRRRSNKRLYEDKPVAEHDLETLAQAGRGEIYGRWFQSEERRRDLSQVCEEAMAIEVCDRKRNAETGRWFRLSDAEFERSRDGFGLPQSGITGVKRWMAESFVLDRKELAEPEGSFARKAVELTREQARSAPAFLIQASPKNDRPTQVNAGRAFARMQLTATRLGLATHPMSQALEEYAEMGPLFERLKRIAGVLPDHTIQMLVRVGYADPTFPAPRRDVADIVRRG